MKCERCDEKMNVTVTTHIGRVTIRYLKCPLCGRTDQSIETFRAEKAKSDTTCSVEHRKQPA